MRHPAATIGFIPVLKGFLAPKAPIAMIKRWFTPSWHEPEVEGGTDATGAASLRHVGLFCAQKGNAFSTYTGLNDEEWIVDDECSDASDDEGAAACSGGSMRVGWPLKLLIGLSLIATGAVIAVFIMASLGLAQVPLASSAAPATDGSASNAAAAVLLKDHMASLGVAGDSVRAARARLLTEKYVQLRFKNDVERMQHLFAEDIKLKVDVSKAGMLVGMKIKSLLNFHSRLIGRDGVVNYYHALPTEPGDAKPRTDSFQCLDDACVVSATVQRPVVGTVTDIATLHWDSKEDLLKRMDLSFWAR